jgi:hypothetical protein
MPVSDNAAAAVTSTPLFGPEKAHVRCLFLGCLVMKKGSGIVFTAVRLGGALLMAEREVKG